MSGLTRCCSTGRCGSVSCPSKETPAPRGFYGPTPSGQRRSVSITCRRATSTRNRMPRNSVVTLDPAFARSRVGRLRPNWRSCSATLIAATLVQRTERSGMPSIDAIERIGPSYATKLRKAGIRTTEALLKRGGTRTGRKGVSSTTGLAENLILEWVNRADLMRVKGIGEEYSDLLEASGVGTVKEQIGRAH